MYWKQVIRELELTKKDRIGFLALIFLVLISVFLPGFFRNHYARRDLLQYDSAWIAELEKWMSDSAAREPREDEFTASRKQPKSKYPTPEPELHPFPFDPNLLDDAGWKSLGLPDRTVRVILNYRSKGGRFWKKEDLSKIYGITAHQYQVLEPFIRLQEKEPYRAEAFPSKQGRLAPVIPMVDINQADTSAFIALPGIGSKLASRILAFREKLGGFYHVSQLKEVYGLADSVYLKIQPFLLRGETPVKRININTATEEELRMHPYLRYQLAKPIIAYRNAHGPFASVEELKKIMAISPDVFEKVSPYLVAD